MTVASPLRVARALRVPSQAFAVGSGWRACLPAFVIALVFSSPLRRNHGALLASLTSSAPGAGVDPARNRSSHRGLHLELSRRLPPGATLVSDMYNDEPRPADDGSLAGWIYYVDSHYCAAIPLPALRPRS
jgi:hypothetical protein